MPADLRRLAAIGDVVEVDVRQPYPATIRLTLTNAEQVAHANALLMDPSSGWRLSPSPQDGRCVQSAPAAADHSSTSSTK